MPGQSIELITTGEYEYAVSMYNLWGDLTDWVELKPAEEDLVKADMVRAAREWLALNLETATPQAGTSITGYATSFTTISRSAMHPLGALRGHMASESAGKR
ncbi:hypothetical protein MPTA5024_26460 [Microbispora sp. ATCC PTA-5024]|nr:hypothetical protein MPTA5024_26460 [Microbispora sp. ATCC PTA-5024]